MKLLSIPTKHFTKVFRTNIVAGESKLFLMKIRAYAGRRTNSRDKNRELFSGELFSGEELLPEKSVLGQ